MDVDDDVARPGDRIGRIAVVERIEPAVLHEQHRLHRILRKSVAPSLHEKLPAEAAGSFGVGTRAGAYAGWNTSVRSSMLSRGKASGGVVGSVNEVCGMNRARPSSLLSMIFSSSASSRRSSGA